MQQYSPRQVGNHGVRTVGDWRLKVYSVCYEPGEISWESFAPGFALAEAALPDVAVTPARVGVGLLIAHRGRTGNYTVLAWWDRENELPLRVFLSRDGHPASWRVSEGSESICVWDLEIIWFEREAYVATVLGPSGADIASYLRRVLPTASADRTLQGEEIV